MIVVGIDLGTTNSTVCLYDGEFSILEKNKSTIPSVVSYCRKSKTFSFGHEAKLYELDENYITVSSFKKYIGTDYIFEFDEKKLKAYELSSMLLRYLVLNAENILGQSIDEVVISVPAYFNEIQRYEVKKAAGDAGLNCHYLINEPTAAALTYCHENIEESSSFLVLDIGGGTFDVSIVEFFEGIMQVRATGGDCFLGGDDFTQVIVDDFLVSNGMDLHKKDRMIEKELFTIADEVKKSIKKGEAVEFSYDFSDTTFRKIYSYEYYLDICNDLLLRIKNTIIDVLESSSLDSSKIANIILVGGASRMDVFKNYISKQLKRFPHFEFDPDLSIARGTALQANLISEGSNIQDVILVDITSFSLGISAYDSIQRKSIFAPIIKRNQILPQKIEQTFYKLHPKQESVQIEIYQGEDRDVSKNLLLGKMFLSFKDEKTYIDSDEIKVVFSYDTNAILKVAVETTVNGNKILQTKEFRRIEPITG